MAENRNGAVRIGCHSGFWGDTETAAVQLVRHGNVDYLVSDYLAEVTMSIMAAQKMRNPQLGYATDFVQVVMAPLAREIAEKIKVVTNAGGVNPQACRDAVLKACEAAGVTLKVAVVLGDDLLLRVDELRGLDIREMDTGAELPAKIVSMNAYLGGFLDRPRARRRRRRGDHRALRRFGGDAGCIDPCLRLEHGRPRQARGRHALVATSSNAARSATAATSPTGGWCPTTTRWASRWPRFQPTARSCWASPTAPAA